MKAPQTIDRIYKIYRIDSLPTHPVNLVNPVYFHCFRTSQRDLLNSSENAPRRRLRCPTCDGNPTTTQKLERYNEHSLYANSYDNLRIGKDNYDAVLLAAGRPTIRRRQTG